MSAKKKSSMTFDIGTEIAEIGRLINSASFLMAIRREVNAVRSGSFVVTDGKHLGGTKKCYEVVVKCSGDTGGITRRINRNIPGVRIEKIAEHIIGIRDTRRGK